MVELTYREHRQWSDAQALLTALKGERVRLASVIVWQVKRQKRRLARECEKAGLDPAAIIAASRAERVARAVRKGGAVKPERLPDLDVRPRVD